MIQGVAAGTGLTIDNVIVLSVKASKFGEAVDYNYIVMAQDTNADALTELVKGAAVTGILLFDYQPLNPFCHIVRLSTLLPLLTYPLNTNPLNTPSHNTLSHNTPS